MQAYVMEENIRRFRAMLGEAQAPQQRLLLKRLLKEEQEKLANLPLRPGTAGSS